MSTRIVVLGGGTGTSTVLRGLKRIEGVQLTAIVSVADSGGSSGLKRKEHHVLPPGDLLQCLQALSTLAPDLLELFAYRFHTGKEEGDTLGNLLLTASQEKFGNVCTSMRRLHELFQVEGRVIPVSYTAQDLCALLEDGTVLEGEHEIDRPSRTSRAPIDDCFLNPVVEACDEAIKAINDADVLIMGPGDLFTSTVPVLLASGIREAIIESRAKLLYVMNLVTHDRQTSRFTAGDHLRKIAHYVGRRFDRVLINNAPFPDEAIARYAVAKEQPVVDDLPQRSDIVRADLLSILIQEPVAGDVVRRSLIRHDSGKLAEAIREAIL